MESSRPSSTSPSVSVVRDEARSPLMFGLLVGAAMVAVDLLGDSLGEALSAPSSRNLLQIVADELLSPSTRELWVRVFLFIAGFVFATLTSRLQAAANARYIHLAYHDTLTTLPNRDHFLRSLEEEAAHARRHHSSMAVFLLGIDHFKSVNDALGHNGGDQLLVSVAVRLATSRADAACIARLCSDRFGMIVRLPAGTGHAPSIANEIQAALSTPYGVEGKDIYMTISVGGTVFPDDGADAEKILHRAEYAMCQAKRLGRGNVCFYFPELEQEAGQRVRIESDLRRAIEREEFFLVYQPIVNARGGEIRSIEALLRWKRSDGSLVPPLDFIPTAESCGLIVPLGAWVLRRACEDTRRWHDIGHTSLSVAVNVSNVQLKHRDFIRTVQNVLDQTGLPATALELEITESMLVNDFESTLVTLTQLREMGIRLSIDDFGTGYSSMSYLGRLPVDKLKIDRSFVSDLSPRSGNEAIVKAVVALAHELRLTVVAEGVETHEQMEFLRTHGCNALQGYLLSRPIEHDACSRVLRSGIATPEHAKAS